MSYIRCWTCNGNGLIQYPGDPVSRCPDCRGTGADADKTRRYVSSSEAHIPAPIPPLSSERRGAQ